MQSQLANLNSENFRLEPVWLVHVELAARDDARVREAVTEVAGLIYGKYDRVAFESAEGLQYFRPREGSHPGAVPSTHSLPVRVLRFSLPRDPELLTTALDAVNRAHSYEEPVVYVTESFASRANYSANRDNPNRWWNRGFEL